MKQVPDNHLFTSDNYVEVAAIVRRALGSKGWADAIHELPARRETLDARENQKSRALIMQYLTTLELPSLEVHETA
jgi:hypothetical protein